MSEDASAYAALGLGPDADAAAIEQAYKRLIKEHHPDRAGGDARRAAEINRAYRELRAERNLKDPLELNDYAPDGTMTRTRGWPVVALMVVSGFALLLFAVRPLGPAADVLRSPVLHRALGAHRNPVPGEEMDRPLHVAAIVGAAQRAQYLARHGDEMTLASASRDCHRQLRNAPSLLQLDRCVAFDDAVVQLEDRDPLRDQGPFSELAVTGRLWSGASALSADYLAIDSRLDRIRLEVEMALAPPPAPVPTPATAG